MSNRATGRTHRMMMQVKDDPKMIVLVHSQAFAEYLKRIYKPKCKVEACNDHEKYRGIAPTLVMEDHYLRENEDWELKNDA